MGMAALIYSFATVENLYMANAFTPTLLQCVTRTLLKYFLQHLELISVIGLSVPCYGPELVLNPVIHKTFFSFLNDT